MKQEIYVSDEQVGKRLDRYLAENLPELSRSSIQNLLEEGSVIVSGGKGKKNYKLRGGETISICIPEPRVVDIEAEEIPIEIIYEDSDMIVVNKPQGMVVHPAVGNWSGTLVNALMYHCGDRLSGINGEIRPGIVHRIDKDTSGLLVVAKNDQAHQNLAEQIKNHSAGRLYQAVVYGTPREEEGVVNRPIARHRTDRKKMAVDPDGREAITHYRVLRHYSGYSYMAFRLETGRTHQIRVHMAYLGHPILGDPLYGPKKDSWKLNGQCLHAYELHLTHPSTGKTMIFKAPLPSYFQEVLRKLERRETL